MITYEFLREMNWKDYVALTSQEKYECKVLLATADLNNAFNGCETDELTDWLKRCYAEKKDIKCELINQETNDIYSFENYRIAAEFLKSSVSKLASNKGKVVNGFKVVPCNTVQYVGYYKQILN